MVVETYTALCAVRHVLTDHLRDGGGRGRVAGERRFRQGQQDCQDTSHMTQKAMSNESCE